MFILSIMQSIQNGGRCEITAPVFVYFSVVQSISKKGCSAIWNQQHSARGDVAHSAHSLGGNLQADS